MSVKGGLQKRFVFFQLTGVAGLDEIVLPGASAGFPPPPRFLCPKGFAVFWWAVVSIHQETRAAYWIAGLSPSSPFPDCMFHFQLLSSRFFTRLSGRSALCRRKERSTPRRRHGQRVPKPRRVASDAFVWILRATPSGGLGFSLVLRVDVDDRLG